VHVFHRLSTCYPWSWQWVFIVYLSQWLFLDQLLSLVRSWSSLVLYMVEPDLLHNIGSCKLSLHSLCIIITWLCTVSMSRGLDHHCLSQFNVACVMHDYQLPKKGYNAPEQYNKWPCAWLSLTRERWLPLVKCIINTVQCMITHW
jgi:hypothetical protein